MGNLATVDDTKKFLFNNKRSLLLALRDDNDLANRYIQGVCNVMATTPSLLKCTLESLRDAVTTSAVLGVPIDGRQLAWLVPYKDKAQFMLSYKGYVHIAKRDPDVDNVQSNIVYKDDEFEYDAFNNTVRHIPDLNSADYGNKDAIIYIYARITYKAAAGRSTIIEVMTKAEVDKIRAGSAAGGEKDAWGNPTIWAKHYGEMARKTVIRRLLKHVQVGDLEYFDAVDNSQYNEQVINVTPNNDGSKQLMVVESPDQIKKQEILEELETCENTKDIEKLQDKYSEAFQDFVLYNVAISKEVGKAIGVKQDAFYHSEVLEALEACEDAESLQVVYKNHERGIQGLKAQPRKEIERKFGELTTQLMDADAPQF
jgi:phage RecT family recombinase